MLIAIDIGNTNILIGIINSKGVITSQHRISTLDFLDSGKKSVTDALTQIKSILTDNQILPNILNSTDEILGMKIDIDKPNELGTDRIINAIAANDEYDAPLIVIDFGTATTFDVIDSSGTYKGGLICPGIKLSLKSLNNDTAQLPLIDLKKTMNVVGRDTKSAIESGIYWGYVSLVEGLIKKIKNEMSIENFTVIGTGGLSHIFKEDIKEINYFNDELTLKGLYLINNKINDKK